MRISPRTWRRLGFGLAIAVAVVIVIRTWVLPAVIVAQIQAQLVGKVTIRDWWLGGRSAGVVGLTVHEGPTARSPVWATIDRVSTDLSLGGLLCGRVMPARIALRQPRVTFRLDRDGRVINLPALRGKGGGPSRLPTVSAEDARVTFRREGRPDDMVVTGVAARLEPEAGRQALRVSADADDPTWGRWDAAGTIDLAAHRGEVRLMSHRFQADPKMLARVPFVPSEVWSHLSPRGPVDVAATLSWGGGQSASFRTQTEVTLLGTYARFPSLGLEASETSGRMSVNGAVVHVEGVQGRSLGGRVAARGTLDFAKRPPRIDLNLDLEKVNVVDAPKSWQLGEAGITGLLTGKVELRAVLASDGVDLSGTSGEAVIEKGSIQGIPVKSLKLAMHASGSDLRYDAGTPSASRARDVILGLAALWPVVHPTDLGPFRDRWAATLADALIALQVTEKVATSKSGRIHLPKTISTQIELEDVDIAKLIARAELLMGIPLPLPITGKLSLKADATIPLGALRELKRYAFHGDVTLTNASIDKVDLGRLNARLDLADGVFALKDLRGVLVDRPDGGPDNPPGKPETTVAATGPLPPGGFRGALAAPALPRPTPLSGLATLDVEAKVDLAAVRDPKAWNVTGKAESVHIRYRGGTLDGVSLAFAVTGGRLDVSKLAATLRGRPLTARAGLDLASPHAFRGAVDIAGWDLASVLALIPSAPRPSPVSGQVSARAEAKGTLSPWAIETHGNGRFARFQAGPVPLGDVPFRWTTERDAVVVSGVEASPFGGRLSAEARVPIVAGEATRGSMTVAGIDMARLSDAIPGEGLKLEGRASGKAAFSIPPGAHSVEATVQLSAPDLTVQGVPTDNLQASLRAHRGTLKYEVTAEGLGGKIKFLGDFPLARAPAGPGAAAPAASNGEVRVVGFTLGSLWKALAVSGAATQIGGLGAVDANIRDIFNGADKGLWAHGIVEFRDLTWGGHMPLGHLRGIVAKSPTAWRVEPLSGELLGGPASGFLWGESPPQGARRVGFNVRIDRAALGQILAPLPALAHGVSGFGTLRLVGALSDVLRVDGEFLVPHARIAGLAVSELRAPAELVFTPATSAGALHLRQCSARLSGGLVRGDATFRLGEDRAFQAQVQLAGVDLQSLTRIDADARRPSSGRISGRITVGGPNPAQMSRYRGRVVLDLDDASLFNLPLFREIDRFLGAARGGLFEDGDLVASIANGMIIVEMFTLEGRLVQLHASGTVGFDGELNLEVLINTNQIIPETGQALVGLIPGLREVLGRGEEAVRRVSNYLSNRLLKLRVTGTVKHPSVAIDSSIAVADTAVGFFAGVLKLPLGFLK